MKLANSLFTPITVFLFLLITPKQCEIKCYSFKGKLDYTHLEGGKEEENRLYILTEFNPDFKKIKWIILQYFVRLCFLKTQLIRYACKFNTGCQLSWIFFFFFLLQLCGVKIGLLWEVADSSAVLLQCWLQRVGWLPVQESGRWLWTGMQGASSWGRCCIACTGFCCPRSDNLRDKTRSLWHLLTHPFPLQRVKWEKEKQSRKCSRCPESLCFPIFPSICM